MPLTITLLSISLLFCACTEQQRIKPSQPVTATGAMTVEGEEEMTDSANEGTPTTTDSLEIKNSTGGTLANSITASGTILTGDTMAPHRLIIFSDYDCTYCNRFSATDLPWIESMTLSKQLAIEHVFVPMSLIGEATARLSICAAQQQKFLEAHRWLIAHPLQKIDVKKFAAAIGVHLKKLTLCTAEKGLLSGHEKKAEEFGVERVPYFVLGSDSWLGLLPKEELRERIEKALKE